MEEAEFLKVVNSDLEEAAKSQNKSLGALIAAGPRTGLACLPRLRITV